MILRQWIHVPDFSWPLRLLLDSNQTGHFLMAHIIFDGIRLGRQKFQNIFSG
jgi:hypothetical protein